MPSGTCLHGCDICRPMPSPCPWPSSGGAAGRWPSKTLPSCWACPPPIRGRAQWLLVLFRALARDECVVLLGDITPEGVETAEVPFFGRPAPFPLGPARLAQRTQAPILVISCVRMPDYTYRLEAQPPLRADPSKPAAAAVLDLTAAIAARFERLIAAWPEPWYPFHP